MKLDLILENVRMKYNMGLLEETTLSERDVLKGKIMINEATMEIRKMLVEEGTMNDVRDLLTESWTGTLFEEAVKQGAEYDAYFAKTLADCGYKSVAAIPKDKKDDFFKKIDTGWNASNESGSDGEK